MKRFNIHHKETVMKYRLLIFIFVVLVIAGCCIKPNVPIVPGV